MKTKEIILERLEKKKEMIRTESDRLNSGVIHDLKLQIDCLEWVLKE